MLDNNHVPTFQEVGLQILPLKLIHKKAQLTNTEFMDNRRLHWHLLEGPHNKVLASWINTAPGNYLGLP